MVKINRFKKVSGKYVEEIIGQSHIGYTMSETIDFYDMIEVLERGSYPGSVISFYDYRNGKIDKPFNKRENVIYGIPVYIQNCFWFLQGDFNENQITLYKYLPGSSLEKITQFHTDAINLYNLKIIGEDVHIISEDDHLICYYPEKFSFLKDSKEGVEMITDGNVYLSAWVEEGWDHENHCASNDYKYYNKVVVRDLRGNIISEEIGSLQQRADGTWWIS